MLLISNSDDLGDKNLLRRVESKNLKNFLHTIFPACYPENYWNHQK